MSKSVIHISEEEAASDFAALMVRVRDGAEVIIEDGTTPVAVLSPAPAGRLLSESIAIAAARGSKVTLDGEFGRDLEAVINSHREPLDPPKWD